MKHFKLAATAFALATLFSTATFAHNYKGENLKGEVPPCPCPAATYSWSGAYVGANLGLQYWTMGVTDIDDFDWGGLLNLESRNDWTVGLQIGWRTAVDCNGYTGVFGVEGSYNWSDPDYSKSVGNNDFDVHTDFHNLWMAQLTGGVAVDRTLLFVAAGIAHANFSGSFTDVAEDDTRNFGPGESAWGPALGIGLEYAITDCVTLRAKVDDISFNRYSVSDSRRTSHSYLIGNDVVQGTIGFNWKFA